MPGGEGRAGEGAERFGLCARCAWGRPFSSGRGALFMACERSRTDLRYPRFPAIPVVVCPGFEPRTEDPGPGPNLVG
jgi:hypothetical protein